MIFNKTCTDMDCPFMNHCIHKMPTFNQNGGCEIQDELIEIAAKVVNNKQQNHQTVAEKVKRYRLMYSERTAFGLFFKCYYFLTYEEAHNYAMNHFVLKKERFILPDGIACRTKIEENRISISCGELFCKWSISSEPIVVTKKEISNNTSKIRIVPPDEHHEWRIQFNYEPQFNEAPAENFLGVFNKYIPLITPKDWIFSTDASGRKIGFQEAEYNVSANEDIVKNIANKLAAFLYTEVEG